MVVAVLVAVDCGSYLDCWRKAAHQRAPRRSSRRLRRRVAVGIEAVVLWWVEESGRKIRRGGAARVRRISCRLHSFSSRSSTCSTTKELAYRPLGASAADASSWCSYCQRGMASNGKKQECGAVSEGTDSVLFSILGTILVPQRSRNPNAENTRLIAFDSALLVD